MQLDLYEIVSTLECNNTARDYGRYLYWASQFGDDPLPERDAGRMYMTEADQRWVILDLLRRQVADDPSGETVDSAHLFEALTANGFCQVFEEVIETNCERAFNIFKTQASASSEAFKA